DFHVTGVQTCALPISDKGSQHNSRRTQRRTENESNACACRSTRNSSFLASLPGKWCGCSSIAPSSRASRDGLLGAIARNMRRVRSEEHTSELQSRENL